MVNQQNNSAHVYEVGLHSQINDYQPSKNYLHWVAINVTGPGKTGLIVSTQNTLVHIMAPISCSACAIQNLLVVMNSLWISAYMMTFEYNMDYR